jgi:hypothetical protein
MMSMMTVPAAGFRRSKLGMLFGMGFQMQPMLSMDLLGKGMLHLGWQPASDTH